MRSRSVAYLAALVCLAALGGRGHAEMINFNYSWSYGPVSVSSTGVGSVSHAISGNVLTLTHAGGTVTMTLPPAGSGSTTLDGPGGFPIPTGTFVATNSVAPVAGDQFFSAIINTKLRVTDLSNGLTGDVALQTTITGVITPGFSYVLASSGGTGYSPGLTLGEHRFGLSGTGFGQPGPQGQGLSFSMSLGAASEASFQTPEPSSLLLGLGAASLCGVGALRRRRRG